MNNLIVLSNDDDWEAIYLNRYKCIGQAHFFDGESLVSTMAQHNIEAKNVKFITASDEDIDDCMNNGNFPENFSELKSKY